MTSFWNLVLFEYKKIIKRKSLIFAILLMIFMSTFALVGNALASSVMRGDVKISGLELLAENLKKEHSVAGYFDDKMISDVIKNNVESKKKKSSSEFKFEGDGYIYDIYDEDTTAYNNHRSQLAYVLSPANAFNFKNFDSLSSSEGIDFYSLRTKYIEEDATLIGYSDKEIAALLAKNEKLETPFYYDYYQGYVMFMIMMGTSAIFIILAITICIAPIFAEEYQRKTDSIILSTKYGKNKLLSAKIFTAVSFSFLFATVALIIAIIANFSVYSTIGGNVSWQMWKLASVYPITMLEAFVIYCSIIICVAMFVSAITAFLSARTSSFATIIIVMLILFGAMLFDAVPNSLRIIRFMLPTKMLDPSYIFSNRLVEIFGFYIESYIFIPIYCAIMMVILIPLARRGFKNHKIAG